MVERVRIIKPVKRRGSPQNMTNAGKGRPKGVPNKTTRLIKEALVLAAEAVGQDNRGKDGLIGYLKWLARAEPPAFASLLGKLLPLQVAGKIDHEHQHNVPLSREEMLQKLEERGIPISGMFLDRDGNPTLAAATLLPPSKRN